MLYRWGSISSERRAPSWCSTSSFPADGERCWTAASVADKLQWLDLSLDLSRPYTLWAGLVGGAFLAMASHGTDQLIVQRLLTCRDLKASQRALIGSGALVLVSSQSS